MGALLLGVHDLLDALFPLGGQHLHIHLIAAWDDLPDIGDLIVHAPVQQKLILLINAP